MIIPGTRRQKIYSFKKKFSPVKEKSDKARFSKVVLSISLKEDVISAMVMSYRISELELVIGITSPVTIKFKNLIESATFNSTFHTRSIPKFDDLNTIVRDPNKDRSPMRKSFLRHFFLWETRKFWWNLMLFFKGFQLQNVLI